MKFPVILYIFIVCVAIAAHAAEQSQSADRLQKPTGGIYVTYDELGREKEKNAIHRQLRARLLYRGKHFAVDYVEPIETKRKEDAAYLVHLCEDYKKNTLVRNCELKKPPRFQAADITCNNPAGSDVLPPLIMDLANRVSQARDCQLVDSFGQAALLNGGLTPFWAQEAIGADLVRKEWSKNSVPHPATFFTLEPIDIRSIDDSSLSSSLKTCKSGNGLSNDCKALLQQYQTNPNQAWSFHATSVAQLVSDPIAGSGVDLKLTDFNGWKATDQIAIIDQAIQDKSSLLCNSLALGGDSGRAMIEAYTKQGGIFVASSGNEYPANSDQNYPDISITVGSISPFGLVSSFSSPAPSVTISAPSDWFVLAGHDRNFSLFSGTSGAQPLACGSIGNVVSLLPGIRLDEMKQLIKETAIPTMNSREKPQLNGSGMINDYKMFRIAQKLRAGWPNNRKQIFGGALNDFQAEAGTLFAQGNKNWNSASVCEKREALDNIRRAYLLDPLNKTYSRSLSKLYSSLGFKVNAHFFDSLSGVSFDQVAQMANDEDFQIRNPALRALAEFGKQAKPVFEKILRSPANYPRQDQRDAEAFMLAAKGLRLLGDTEGLDQKMLAVFDQPGNGDGFNHTFFQDAIMELGLPKEEFSGACVKNAKGTIDYACVSIGFQQYEPQVNQRDLDDFISSLDGRLDHVDSSQLSSSLRIILTKGTNGRQFLERQRTNSSYSKAVLDAIAAALGA